MGWRPIVARLLSASTVFFAVVAAGPGRAHADEDEWRFSARAGIATVAVDNRNPAGLETGIDIQYGLSDAWALRLDGGLGRFGVHANPDNGLPGGHVLAYSAFAGVTYTLDVLRLVPYFDLGVGMFGVSGSVIHKFRSLGTRAAVGAEYLLSPRWAVGAVADYVFPPFDLLANAISGGGAPYTFGFSLRATFIIP